MLGLWLAQRREKRRLEDAHREAAKAAAIEIARQVCMDNGWIWAEPIDAGLRNGKWWVSVNTLSRGCNAHVLIDERTGEVLEKGYAPR